MLPGVQVLFAFRLAVPSSARVGDVMRLQQAVLVDPLIHGNLAAPQTSPKEVWRTIARAGTIMVGTAPRVGGTGPMD